MREAGDAGQGARLGSGLSGDELLEVADGVFRAVQVAERVSTLVICGRTRVGRSGWDRGGKGGNVLALDADCDQHQQSRVSTKGESVER